MRGVSGLAVAPLNAADWKLLRFILVGTCSAAIYFSLVWLLLETTSLSMFSSSVIGYSLVVGATYLAQRNWTFRSSAPYGQSLLKYLGVQLLCMLVTAALSQLFASLLNLVPLHASLLSTAITSVISFVLSLFWVFAELQRPEA